MDFGIEDVKRWQWALLGIAVGLALAYAQNEFGDDIPARTMDPYTFVTALRRTPYPNGDTPLPWLDRIVVYPRGDDEYWVRAQRLEFTDNRRVVVYKTYTLTDWKGVPASPWGGGGGGGRRGAAGAGKAGPAPQAGEESVLAFMAQTAKRYPHVKYRYAWWAAPRHRMLTYSAAGLVLIGGIWPTLLKLLTGAGFGRAREPEPDYDLSRFKGEAAPAATAAPPAASEELDAQLLAMEQKLLAGIGNTAPAPGEARPEAAPVRVLKRGGAVDEMEAGVAQDGEDKEYKGEFYPVALKPGEKHHEHRP
jgi:hypothetical protein